MTEEFTADAREFLEGPATEDRLACLARLPLGALERVVAELVAREARTHLELIGDSRLPKSVRKAARTAAYKLKSRGVEAAARARTAWVAPNEAVVLDEVALAMAPGMYGYYWLILGSLPGVSAVEIRGTEGGVLEHVDVLPPLTPGRLGKILKQAAGAAKLGDPTPIRCSAHLAVRLINQMAELLRQTGGRFTERWIDVVAWRDAAIQHGADPGRADARQLLADDLADEGAGPSWRESAWLMTVEGSGLHVPPTRVLGELLERGVEASEARGGQTDEESRAALWALADQTASAWLAKPATRGQVAHLLESTADVVLTRGGREAAVGFLRVADALRGRPETAAAEIGFISAAFRQVVDDELAQVFYGGRGPQDEGGGS